MDETRLRKLSGLLLNESIVVDYEAKKGLPGVEISFGLVETPYGKRADPRRRARFRTFEVVVPGKKDGPIITRDNAAEIAKAEDKLGEEMLEKIKKLSEKFAADVEKLLKQ